MNYKDLLRTGKTHLEKFPDNAAVPGPLHIFPSGARWMFDRLNELDGKKEQAFNTTVNYNFYGCLKYGVCLTGFGLSICCCLHYNYWCIPMSILLFYVLEVHFLFLFPLLIDNSQRPMLTGIQKTYQLGLFKCLFTVVPIAIFMLLGLLRKKDPFRNWHIGCLAILIWYKNEVRNRI